MKVTFMGAGSTIFSKNVLGDTMLCDAFHDCEIALYDIDKQRLEESYLLITKMNESINESRATIKKYLGVEQRKDALRNADFVVNAIQCVRSSFSSQFHLVDYPRHIRISSGHW